MKDHLSLTTKGIVALISLVVVTLHFYLIISHSWNVPDWDDYDMLLAPLLEYIEGTSLPSSGSNLLQLHNEHLVAIERLIPLGWYKLFGNINYQALIILGNYSFFVGLLVFYKSCRFGNPLAFLIFCLIIFQPQYRQSTVWATGSLQNLGALSFTLLAFACLVSNSSLKNVVAIALCLLAVLTQANGIFCLPTIAIVFLLQKKKGLAAILGVLGLMIAAWHIGRLSPVSGPSPLSNLHDRLLYFTVFLGSFTQNLPLSIAFGSLFIMGLLIITYRKQYVHHPQLYALILFIFLSAGANSLSRLQFGLDYPIKEGRYQLLSLMLLISFWFLLLKAFETKALFYKTNVCLAAIFFLYSYYVSFNWLPQHSQRVEEGVIRWQIAHTDLEYPNQDRAAQLLVKSLERKLYEMPFLNIRPWLGTPLVTQIPQSAKASIISQVERIVVGKEYFLISGWAFPAQRLSSEWTTKIVLEGDTQSFILTPHARIRPEVSRHHRASDLDYSGFLLIARRADLAPLENETFRVGIAIEQRASPTLLKREVKTVTFTQAD